LNSRIGTNIVSPGANFFEWSPGYTNSYDLTQPLGDHQAAVVGGNLVIPLQPGPGQIISFSANGTLVTNSIIPVPMFGDVVNREGVMAVEFYISGDRHYGYIHFDFRSGVADVFQKKLMRRRVVGELAADARVRHFLQHISLVRDENFVPEIRRLLQQRRIRMPRKFHARELRHARFHLQLLPFCDGSYVHAHSTLARQSSGRNRFNGQAMNPGAWWANVDW
jgi:hypothetical protein